MTGITQEQVRAGQAVYTPFTLAFYDLVVLGVSNRFIRKCPTSRILAHYNRYVSGNHLDVGVGTGYFLDQCGFPSPSTRTVSMDLNASSLAAASRRICRYAPETLQHNILEPWTHEAAHFDSIGINCLFHCLPGTMRTKGAVFRHLTPKLNPGGMLFGATLLGRGVSRSAAAQRPVRAYNRKGIFTNIEDDAETLNARLTQHFAESGVEIAGCAALFRGRQS